MAPAKSGSGSSVVVPPTLARLPTLRWTWPASWLGVGKYTGRSTSSRPMKLVLPRSSRGCRSACEVVAVRVVCGASVTANVAAVPWVPRSRKTWPPVT